MVEEESEKKSAELALVGTELETLLKEFSEFRMQCQGLEEKVKQETEKWKVTLEGEAEEHFEDVEDFEVVEAEEQQESK